MPISCSKIKMNTRTLQYVVSGKWREVGEGKRMCVCKRIRSSMRMGWYHMVSETSTERLVFRARAGPLCPAESSKMQLCGHHEKAETVTGTVSVRAFDVCAATKFIHELCVRRHRFCMTTKSPTLNISAFVPSSVRGFEKPGQTRLPCVFDALLRCAHTLTCIVRGLHLHLSTCSCMSKVRCQHPPLCCCRRGTHF